ncbi:UNVERIFIED_CONTAM: hypothetical protein FKN15_076517 [Acipenser sinensis]
MQALHRVLPLSGWNGGAACPEEEDGGKEKGAGQEGGGAAAPVGGRRNKEAVSSGKKAGAQASSNQKGEPERPAPTRGETEYPAAKRREPERPAPLGEVLLPQQECSAPPASKLQAGISAFYAAGEEGKKCLHQVPRWPGMVPSAESLGMGQWTPPFWMNRRSQQFRCQHCHYRHCRRLPRVSSCRCLQMVS